LFLLGAPCAGKSTLVPLLREVLDCPVLDMDDELLRLNGATWPALEAKRDLTSQVIAEATRLDRVLLAHSYLDDEQLGWLRSSGWVIGLLDLPEAVMRSRAEERLARDGWTNVEWLPFHLENIEHLSAQQAFGHVYDATMSATSLVEALAETMDE
jgi:hypothetical protein